MSKLHRFVLPIAIAVVLGPLVAGIAVSLWAVFNNILHPVLSLSSVIIMFNFYIMFAYIAGTPIALLAGLLMSVWMVWHPPNLLVAIGAAVLATVVYMGIGGTGVLGDVELTNARSNGFFTLATAVIAAAGCWLITGRFVRTA